MIFVEIGEFSKSLIVSAALAGALLLTQSSFQPIFALGLVAFSTAGYFALLSMRKAGMGQKNANLVVLGCSVACLLLASLSNSSLGFAIPLLFLPLAFSVPALFSLSAAFASQLSR